METKRKFDGMLAATFFSGLFYSATYPYIYKEIMAVADTSIIALAQIIICLSVILFGTMWNKYSEKIFKFYPAYCILETFFSVSVAIFVIMTHHIVAYYMLDTLVCAILTRNICCGAVKLKAIRYSTEDSREHFDNNNNSYSSFATIIGSIIAMFLNLDFNIMICIATFGGAIDNISYLFIFHNTRKNNK